MYNVIFVFALFFSSADTCEVTINITNIKEKNGKLLIAFFESKEDYLENEHSSFSFDVKNEAEKSVKVEIPKGTYALAVFHDINNNDELDKNFFGIPKESFGFSNKSVTLTGPPSFDQAKVDLSGTKAVVNIKLVSF